MAAKQDEAGNTVYTIVSVTLQREMVFENRCIWNPLILFIVFAKKVYLNLFAPSHIYELNIYDLCVFLTVNVHVPCKFGAKIV